MNDLEGPRYMVSPRAPKISGPALPRRQWRRFSLGCRSTTGGGVVRLIDLITQASSIIEGGHPFGRGFGHRSGTVVHWRQLTGIR
jgi:hypothetical protein